MNKILSRYKKQKSWVKGGILGALIGFMFFLIIDLLARWLGQGSLDKISLPLFIKFIMIIYLLPSTILVSFLTGGGEPGPLSSLFNYLLWYISSTIFYGVIGIIIGLIIGKLKKQR
jgi:hypothetical protein